jgi:hypothetical protein
MCSLEILSVGWSALLLLDRGVQPPFSVDDVYVAIRQGNLVELLLQVDERHLISGWANRPNVRLEVEEALAHVSERLRDRETGQNTGLLDGDIETNAFSLVAALAMFALGSKCSRPPPWGLQAC